MLRAAAQSNSAFDAKPTPTAAGTSSAPSKNAAVGADMSHTADRLNSHILYQPQQRSTSRVFMSRRSEPRSQSLSYRAAHARDSIDPVSLPYQPQQRSTSRVSMSRRSEPRSQSLSYRAAHAGASKDKDTQSRMSYSLASTRFKKSQHGAAHSQTTTKMDQLAEQTVRNSEGRDGCTTEALGLSMKREFTNAKTVATNQRLMDKQKAVPPFRVPLWCVLVGQCGLIVGVFIVLIAVVSVRMNSTTRDLVYERITADLRYMRSSILEPMLSGERILISHRLRYIADSMDRGAPMCADNNTFSESTAFIRDALSTVEAYPDTIAFVATLQRSDIYHNHSRQLSTIAECAVSLNYLYVRSGGVIRITDGPVSIYDTTGKASAAFSGPLQNFFEYPDSEEAYISYALNAYKLTWRPYLWIDPELHQDLLLIGGYVPMMVNTTYPNGTVVRSYVDLDSANELDPAVTTILSSFCVDIRLAEVNSLIRGITPVTEGAHTSLYDLVGRTLLATTVDIPLNDANDEMWPVGASPSEAINRAFREVNPQYGADGVEIIRSSDHIDSVVHIATETGLELVIIQSTPEAYYFSAVTQLLAVMVALGVVSAVVIVAICTVIVLLIRRSIAEIQEGMLLAAVLKNDKVRPVRSVMTEIDNLCLAFDQMNEKLGAARAYMPQSMLTTDSDGTTDEEEGEANVANEDDATTAPKASASVSRSEHVSESGNNDYTVSKEKPTNNKDANNHGGVRSRFNNAGGLSVKRVTVLCLNTRGFHRRAGGDGVVLGAVSADLTATLQAICAQQRGVIDSFHGDHYVLSFNAAKHNAQGPAMAVQCALDVAAALGGPASKVGGFAMGVSSGRALVGHLGSSDLKRFSIVGKAYSRAVALERVCRLVADEAPLTPDNNSTLIDIMNDMNVVSAFGEASMSVSKEENLPQAAASAAAAAATAGIGGPVASSAWPAVNLVADASVVPDIEHAYFVQVLGKLCESSPPPSSSGVAADGSLGETLVYAVRGPSTSAGGEADEWMYELRGAEGGGQSDRVLPAVNKVMERLVRGGVGSDIWVDDVSLGLFRQALAAIAASGALPAAGSGKAGDVGKGEGGAGLPFGSEWGAAAYSRAAGFVQMGGVSFIDHGAISNRLLFVQ